MTYILLTAAALYLWGCFKAYRAITRSTQAYDGHILLRGVLMSWLAVLLMEE